MFRFDLESPRDGGLSRLSMPECVVGLSQARQRAHVIGSRRCRALVKGDRCGGIVQEERQRGNPRCAFREYRVVDGKHRVGEERRPGRVVVVLHASRQAQRFWNRPPKLAGI